MAQSEDLNSTRIANCVFNALLSCTAIMLNIITMLALRKTSSLPKPLKTFLASMAVSDIGVGLLVQPLYIAFLVMVKEQNTETETFRITQNAFNMSGNIFSYASFFGVVVVNADRFLAIHLHLRYQELVTHKRVVAVVISVWVFSAILTLILFWWIPANVGNIIAATIEGVCYLTTAFFYFKIYLAVRRHSNQVHALQVQPQAQNKVAEASNFARLIKYAVSTFYVYLVFLACYLPSLCTGVIKRTTELNNVTTHLSLYAITLVYLNSSLNPLIYCWKMRHIRHAFMDILRNHRFPSRK